ncbi:unnamed protein product [Meganyctiphanes norvegica]|uniref:PX domain-containing protein n=1 Tax=Meganyctiphanes norvegica TaxID=48144 RepID=A0AAV2PLC7_MEGNR
MNPNNRNSNVIQNRSLLSPHTQNHWWNAESNMTSSASSPDTEHTTDSGETWDVSSPNTEMPTHHSQRDYRHDTNILLYRMPICGYEVVEHSTRFTVFKIQVVHQPSSEHWFVFRRFTDFVRLNKKLKAEFPGLRFSLPPKRWLGDNFDPVFLENRQCSLQAFIDNVTGHAGVREARSLREFFCLDDPPEPYDSLEECRAVCGSLEDACRVLQERVRDRDGQITVLKSQVSFLTSQQALLVKALRLECDLNENGDKYENSEAEMAESEKSTHQLNLALLKLCEDSLQRGLPNANQLSSFTRSSSFSDGCNSVKSLADDNNSAMSPVSHLDVPVSQVLEKVILKRCASQAAVSTNLRPLPQPLDAVVSAPVSQRTSLSDIRE